jgi:hypothetical protein
MPEVTSTHAIHRQIDSDVVKSIWEELRGHLEDKKNQIVDEIKNYPPPIPACDQHFNYLLEERANISRELNRLEACAKESLARADPGKLIDAFVGTSTYMSAEVKQKMRASLQTAR